MPIPHHVLFGMSMPESESGENIGEKKMETKKEQEIVLCLTVDFCETRQWTKMYLEKNTVDFTYLSCHKID